MLFESPKRPVLDIVSCLEEGSIELTTYSPWTLSSLSVDKAMEVTGYGPRDGMKNLMLLMASAGFLNVHMENFTPSVSFDDLNQISDEDMALALVEGFTQNLAPPNIIAYFMSGLGIHPIWGLSCSTALRNEGSMSNIPRTFEAVNIDMGIEFIFGAIKRYISFLIEIGDGLHDLDLLIGPALLDMRTFKDDFVSHHNFATSSGADFFIGDIDPSFLGDFFRLFIEVILWPAGVAKRNDDGMYRIDTELLGKVVCGRKKS